MRNTKATIKGGNAGRNRGHNRRVVLDYVRRNEPTGRAEIARSCGLSVQAVSNITDALAADGLLQVVGKTTGKRGKPVVQYRFNPDESYAVGIEMRPDAMVCAVLNLNGKLIVADRIAISNATPERAIPMACALIEKTINSAGRPPDKLLGVGVVMPGPFGESALSGIGDANLPGWQNTDIKHSFEKALGCTVVVENDATAAAISERVAGVATKIDDLCFIYFGTGLGLGVIAGGHSQSGAFGNFGEIGHIITQIDGNICTCGNSGCLETYASRMAAKTYLEMRGHTAIDTQAITRLMAENDPDLRAWIGQAATHLSLAIGMIENIFDPETVVLGGAMPDSIIEALIAQLTLPHGSVANRKDRSMPRIIKGASGRNTAAIGGASIIIHQTTTPALSLFN
ncbi:MAG: ROK family transcriptional regulator [Rhodobacteraceae bacterium]|nr:ROK family transcriptional regulator [Paracoccaceae bacterium]